MRSDGVLGGQRAAAEDDEDQDEVGEDVMVDQSVTGHTDPRDRQTDRQTDSFGFRSPKRKRLLLADSRVCLAQAKKGAAFRDGKNLLFGRRQVGHL